MLANRMLKAASGIPEFRFTLTTVGVSDTFALPLEASGTYDFTIDWGDGSSSAITIWNHADATHTYAVQDTYTVRIRGTITGWRFNNAGDRTLIRDIKSWGPLNLGTNNGYFYGCSNLTISATDILDLTNTTTFQSGFRATAITTIPSINSWDFSSIFNLSRVWVGAVSYNQMLSIDTSNVTSMAFTFSAAVSFNQNLGALDITSLIDASNFLNGVTLSTANYDALLIGWEGQAQQPNVTFSGGNSKYTGGGAAATARAALVTDGWIITDGGIA